VETRQAGESLVCDCGTKVAVPTLRQLRQLPAAREETTAAAGPAWGLREAAITVCLLLAAVCLTLSGVSRYSERPVPSIDAVKYSENVDRLVSNMTPLEGWQRWIDTYQPLSATGFEVYKHPATDAMQQDLNWHRAIQISLLAAAAVCVLAAVLLGWVVPRSASRLD
jgi:hypothetical protein